MQAIQGFLDELHHYAGINTPLVSEAVAVASDLRAYLKEVTENDLGMCSSLLFESPTSALNFLLKTTQNKELAKTKEELLEMLLDFIKQIGVKGVSTYAVSIGDACFSVFRSDQTSKVKTMCLPVIIKLVRMKIATLTAENFRVHSKVETLLTELAYNKNTQTVKGNILQTLGVLAEHFPEHLVGQAKTLLVMLSDLLSEQFKDKKPDYQVIDGGMRGLISLLVHFSGEVTSDPKKVATIWRFTLACLNPPEGLKTYAIPKAGLMMVEKHAELFKQYLTEKSSTVYPLIKTYCTHATNRGMRKFGFSALEAFLYQVAHEIVSEDRTKDANMATLRFFFEEFWAGLQERNTGLLTSSVYVRGLGIFAKSIDYYMGPTEVKKMLHKLIVFSSRFYEGGQSSLGMDAEETIEHMPSILAAYANIIMELPDVDEACIDALERIIGSFFLVFPQLYEYQRISNYKSLSRLLVALHSKGNALENLLSRVVVQGLMLTCSKPVPVQTNQPGADLRAPSATSTDSASNPAQGAAPSLMANTSTDFFFEYQDLWRNLIDIHKIPGLGVEKEIYQMLSKLVYGKLMEAVMKLLRKLDLRYSVVKESELHLPLNPAMMVAISVDTSLTLIQADYVDSFSAASQSDHSLPSSSTVASASLPSMFDSSMDLDSSQSSQNPLSGQQSPSRAQKAKPVADINKNEFLGCARTIMPGETIKPWIPKDFELFLHLVEFLKLFLPHTKTYLFNDYVFSFIKEVTSKSTDFQLISGLYKLLGVALKICSTNRYFKDLGHKGLIHEREEPDPEKAEAAKTKKRSFKLISKFVRELAVRLRQYRDELLASCIQATLSIPSEFLDVKIYTPCLTRAFAMGLGFLPLTDIGLSALENWYDEQPHEVKEVLPQILPVLNPYLYITKEEVESNLASNERYSSSSSSSSWVFGYGADKPGSGTGKHLATTANEYRPEHSMTMQSNIQVRILRFLGKLGGANAKVISDVEGQSRGVAWDSTPRVSLAMAYQGGILNLHLDDLLPSLCHLATTSSSRQTKIAACEFVHAVCLNITNQDDGKGVYEQIYAKLFPIVIQLATDVEKITRQLFEPLTSHLIKWSILTGNDKATNVLLSSLTDSLSSETDGALRSFSASSLTHFLKMYFELKRGKQSLTILFSLLPSLACHPNPYKRLGSVLAFKQLCTVMQRHRDDAHFDLSMIQLLEIMNSMFSALHLTTREHQSIGIEGLALQVIEQLGSLIEHFAEALFPHGLSHFVTFLFVTYCGHVRRPVRVCAQAQFEKLLRLLPHTPTPAQWIKNRMSGNGAIYDVFDRALPKTPSKPKIGNSAGGGSQSMDISGSLPVISSLDVVGNDGSFDGQHFSFKTDKPVSLQVFEAEEMSKLLEKAIAQQKIGSLDGTECQRWFSGMTAWLDSLFWLLSNGHIQVTELTNPARLNPIFQHATLFLKTYAMMDLATGSFATMTPQELDTHTQARCTATLSIFALASLMLDKGALNLMQDVLYRSLIVAMLVPHMLGFPLYSAQDQRRVRKYTTKLVTSIVRNLSNCATSNVAGQEAYNRFNSCTTGVINRAELNIMNLTFTAGQIEVEKMRYVAIGIYDLNRSGILAQRHKHYPQLAAHLLAQVAVNHSSCSPLERSSLRKIVKLALVLPLEPSLLLDYLKDTSAIGTPTTEEANRMAVDPAAGVKRRHITKGEQFYTHFKSHIDEYFTHNVEKVLGPLLTLASTSHPQLFKIVLAILDLQLSNVRHARIPPHKVDLAIEALSGNFFSSWISADASFDQRDCMLEYVKKISTMNATQPIKNAKMLDFLMRTFESFMAKEQPLWFKVHVLSLLPLLLPHLPSVYVERLIKPLEVMIIFDFPSKSSLLTPDSAAYAEYIGALDSLLSTLSTTYSIDLLEALFPILNDNKHVHMLHIDKALETFVKGVKPENAPKLFRVCFHAFLEATPNLETLRLALIRKVCVPFMLCVNNNTLMDILKVEATRIFGIIFPVLPEITSPKPDSKPPMVDRLTTVARIGAFHLVQAIFSALSHQDRETLNPLVVPPKDIKAGSLSQKAMRCAFAVRNKKHAEFASDVSGEVQLEYQRAAYHCLSTVLMKAKPSNIKFFEVFGFTEDIKKGDLLWEHAVDLESKFSFSVETHFPIANKTVSAIYSKASQKHVAPMYSQSSASMAAVGAITGSLNPRRYLTSSYFVDSSLSQEAAESAFFLSPEVAQPSGTGTGASGAPIEVNSLELMEDNVITAAPPVGGEIELDPLNTNPCMFNMLDMIDDLNMKFGDQLAATAGMPVWMTEVYKKLERADTHINVKLFITKLIMNKPEAFENYASDWFSPLCRVLLNNMDTVGNPGFNYFVRDLCIVFLRWPKFVPQQAEQKQLAAQFMEYLMRNATHSSRRVITSNIQIIKLLVERWRDCLVDKVPRKLITDLLVLERKSTLASRLYRLVGVQILGCLISNKIGLWNDVNFGHGNPALAVNKRAFMEGIVNLLSYGYREVHQAAGELVGLAFLYQSPGADDTLMQMVKDKMTALFNAEELPKFVTVLERISRHYPIIVDTFIQRLLVSLKKLGDDKVKALEIALLRIAEMSDPFAAIVPNLESLLRHRDDATQLATLNILHVIYRTIPTKELQGLIPTLTASFADHLNDAVRSRYLELLMQIFDEARPDMENDEPLRLGLLRGLADQSSDISSALFDFWDRDGRLSTQPSTRLQQLMVKFYHPDVETHWLKMSSHLMMRLFQNHKSYEAVVSTLAHGTDGAEISLDDSTAMVGIMEPSAATYVKQTLSDSQMMDSVEGTSPAKKTKDTFAKYHTLYFETLPSAPPPPPDKSRATAAPRPIVDSTQGGFKTPTKPTSKVKSESGGTGAADDAEKVAYGSPVSLMPPPKTPPRRISSNAPMSLTSPGSSSLAIFDDGSSSSSSSSSSGSNAGEASRVRITRRFANSPIASMGSSHFHRQRELANRKQREANARELARKRLHHVQLHRTYASGVKTLSNKDIIGPLVAVALRNDSIARLLLSILVNSMRDLVDTAMLQTTLGNLLESSHSGSLHADTSLPSTAQQVISSSISTPFINCLLRIVHDHPTLVVPSRLIADCAIKSLNFHLGIITLEKQVMKYQSLLSTTTTTPAKARSSKSEVISNATISFPLIDDTWAQLVRLYKILGEEDVLRGLYEKPSLTTRADVKAALAAELEGEFEEANERYFAILNEHSARGGKGRAMAVDGENEPISEVELDMVQAGQLNCLVKLSEWRTLSEVVYQHLSNDMESDAHRGPESLDDMKVPDGSKDDPLPSLWTPANREKYMKYFLSSCLMEKDRWPFLFAWSEAVQDKRTSLEGEFSSELAYLAVIRNDVGRADSYIRQAFRHFLGSWSVLPPSMATAAQLKLLQTLQPLLELEEYLNFATNAKNAESIDPMNQILHLWRHRYPEKKRDDFEVWDRVGKQRAQFFNLIATFYIEHQQNQKAAKRSQPIASASQPEQPAVDVNAMKRTLKNDRDNVFINMAIAARKQSRLTTSDRILAGVEAKLPPGRPISFQVFLPRLKTDLATVRHANGMSSNAASHSIAPATSQLLASYASIWQRIGQREDMLSEEQLGHRSELNLLKSKLILDILDMQTAHRTQFSTSWKELTPGSRQSLSFVQEGTLKEVGRAAFETIIENATSNPQLLAKTHFKFARFCDKVSSTQTGQPRHQYSLDAVRHMFKAIILGHQAAIGSVPLVLRILSSYRTSSSSNLTKGSSSSSGVSAAMRQVGELFDTLGREVPAWNWLRWVNQLIGLIDHPEFVFILPLLESIAEAYPQALYYHFRISTDKDFGVRPVEARLRKLQNLLRNDMLDKFVYAMEQLTNPEHRAKAWMSAMNVHYQNAPVLNKLYRAFVEDCLLVSSDTGDLNRQFASKIPGREVRDRGGEGMPPVDRELIQRIHKSVNEVCANFTAISDKSNTVAHYTKWLDTYSSTLGMKTGEIEIPGLYTGLSKPQPESHVKVSSFDKSLLIMTSMRRPKRLKIRGTDEKEYWFLVKGGEDLRQDQRVEQLFEICNHLFETDVETSKRNLSVHTYKVIPMTTRAGILEWIRDTAPLKAVVDAQAHPGFKTCVDEHDKFLGRTPKFKGAIQELYKGAFKRAGYDEVAAKLTKQHECLPGDLLRAKIIALSADPEAFLGIRQKAATSIAVFSIVSYIIGIGDRHLDNFLINMKDGEFIGIDFGYAFDAATLLLPIPELVPFRLTRQLTELLKPLDTDGLLKLTMVHALTALVRNRHLLLDAMDLFVNEPLLDWSMWANKLPQKPSIETYTRDRLRTVEQKLSLVDPGHITAQLLKGSIHHADEYCDNLVKIVSPKAPQGRQCTSVKAQVERLIEQATNPHILGMAWAGWCPWV